MSFILLGVLNSQIEAAGGGAYDLLETTTSSGSTISFTNLNTYSGYKHLQIRAVIQPDLSRDIKLRLNNISTSSYAWHALRGTGSAVQVQAATSQTEVQTGEPLSTTIYSPYIIDILDFNNTSKNKTVRILYGVPIADYYVGLTSGLFNSTNAVTSIQLFSSSAVLSGRFSLYGIKG